MRATPGKKSAERRFSEMQILSASFSLTYWNSTRKFECKKYEWKLCDNGELTAVSRFVLQVQSGGRREVVAGADEFGQRSLRCIDLWESQQVPADGQMESRATRQVLPWIFCWDCWFRTFWRGEPRWRPAQGLSIVSAHESAAQSELFHYTQF